MKKNGYFVFRLYIAGDAPNSLLAADNLLAICREFLAESHEIEIVDVLREPRRVLADDILLTPALVKLSPAPLRKIVGNLSQRDPVLQALGLPVELQ